MSRLLLALTSRNIPRSIIEKVPNASIVEQCNMRGGDFVREVTVSMVWKCSPNDRQSNPRSIPRPNTWATNAIL